MAGETYKNDVIVPEVMGDMINAKIEAQCKLTPYAKVDTTLEGVPGDTKTVPSWNYIGDAVDVAEGEEVDLTTMTAGKKQFTIKKAMKAVGISQEAINSGLGNPVGQAERQLALSVAGKVDSDLVEASYTAPVVVDKSSAAICYDSIVDAACAFGDEEDGIDKVMFIHPKQQSALLKDDDFRSADKFESGVAVRGAIGMIAGCWVKKSKKVQAFDAVDAVAGVYTVEIKGTVAEGDKITVAGETVTLDSSTAASATAAATAVATALGSHATYSVTRSTAKLTLTEKTGKEGTGAPVCSIESEEATLEEKTTTEGVKAELAHYKCPIIKMEPESEETEETEDELPALSIFLKKELTISKDFIAKKQMNEIVVAKYYGVALTNESKVVLAKFGK